MINNQLYLQVKGKWKSVYPIYFDSTKTIAQGRRLSKNISIDNPTLQELIKAVCACKLRHVIEPHKAYTRDYFQMGRLKVQMFNDDGSLVHKHIPNKKIMLKCIAKEISKLRQK